MMTEVDQKPADVTRGEIIGAVLTGAVIGFIVACLVGKRQADAVMRAGALDDAGVLATEYSGAITRPVFTPRAAVSEGVVGEAASMLSVLPPRHVYQMKARRQFVVTAFCPCEKCCPGTADGITASGQPVTGNGGKFCAADRSIPFGTMIDIPGYGRVPVLDRGGAIRGDKLDVFFPTHRQAKAWGVQRLIVTIEKGDE
jgi:3D (Asp-Asp-Asp) domain-containing protein